MWHKCDQQILIYDKIQRTMRSQKVTKPNTNNNNNVNQTEKKKNRTPTSVTAQATTFHRHRSKRTKNDSKTEIYRHI